MLDLDAIERESAARVSEYGPKTVGRQREEARHAATMAMVQRIREQDAEILRLRALVEEAYREGYSMGWGVGGITAFAQPSDKDQAWQGSRARDHLRKTGNVERSQ